MQIKEYWDQRALSAPQRATTNDIYLRVLEREVLCHELRQLGCGLKSKVLDLGCGDGQTVEYFFNELGCQITGVDYSPAMIQLSRDRLAGIPAEVRPDLVLGDVGDAVKILGEKQFDFVITDRCLINMETAAEQFKSIEEIARLVGDDGYYLAIENFEEGQEQLNHIRDLFELPPIPVRWHNRYFKEHEFVAQACKYFGEVRKVNFSSSYYLATRVIYSKLCQLEGVEPDYSHPIHQLGTRLPHFGEFSPIKLFIMTK